MSPADTVSPDLRCAANSGSPEEILAAVEDALNSELRELHAQASALYEQWFCPAVEDEALADRAGVLDRRIAAARS